MRQRTKIFLQICLTLILCCVTGCDFAPAIMQSAEQSTIDNIAFEENSENISEDTSEETTQSVTIIYVHVCGFVKKPGLYELPSGSRADAAVSAAGGMTDEADEKQINLAQILEDGMQLYVPSKEECSADQGETQNSGMSGNTQNEKEENKVNLNTATAEELMTLSGIGESRANAIIEYRETNGLFLAPGDIKNVSGIGDGLYEKIKDDITI